MKDQIKDATLNSLKKAPHRALFAYSKPFNRLARSIIFL